MDEVGQYTLEVMSLAGWYNNWLFSFIVPDIEGDLLEVGAGIGNFTSLLIKKCTVTAIDLNPSYVSSLKKQFKTRINVGYGDIEKAKYFFNKNTKFNTIVCLNVLEHIKNDSRALNNMFSLLKPEGKLILLVPAHQILYSNFDKSLGHFRRYSISSINELLLKSGYKEISIRYFNWISAVGWFVFLKVTGWKKIPGKEVGIFNFLGKFLLWPEKYIKFPFGLSVIAIAQK